MKSRQQKWGAAIAGGLVALALAAAPAAAQVAVDKALPEYKPVQGISGSLKSVGSDTLNNLMTFWAEGFKKHYPNPLLTPCTVRQRSRHGGDSACDDQSRLPWLQLRKQHQTV